MAPGATDTGTGERVPRPDVALLADRFGINAVSAWVQFEPTEVPLPEVGAADVVPEALELPPLTNGTYFSYAAHDSPSPFLELAPTFTSFASLSGSDRLRSPRTPPTDTGRVGACG
ncbi:MAG: hypothetical protein R2706_03920 [Acidimicrobiales bacterium]